MTRYGDLDIMELPAGINDFASLLSRTRTEVLDGISVPLASLDDIIASKETANRPKDQYALPILRELREMIRRQAAD